MVERGLKQFKTYRALAAKVGIPAQTLHRIATGKQEPSILLVNRLSAGLGETFSIGVIARRLSRIRDKKV